MEALQSWIFWLLRSSWYFEELWSSRHQHSKHNDTPSWQFYTCLDWLLSHFILSFQLFFHPLQSLVSSLCPIRQLIILTCLYWSHLPLAYWVFLSDQQIVFSFSPLSFILSFLLAFHHFYLLSQWVQAPGIVVREWFSWKQRADGSMQSQHWKYKLHLPTYH